MALIIIGLLCSGISMTNLVPSDAQYRGDLYNLHKSFGVIALLLIFVRILNRIKNKPPALPESIKKIEQIAAHIGHYSLYIAMLLMPLSGYLMSNSYGYKVKLFGLALPNLVSKNYEMGAIFSATHQYLGYATIAIVLAHIAGALKHRFLDANPNNDVLKRML